MDEIATSLRSSQWQKEENRTRWRRNGGNRGWDCHLLLTQKYKILKSCGNKCVKYLVSPELKFRACHAITLKFLVFSEKANINIKSVGCSGWDCHVASLLAMTKKENYALFFVIKASTRLLKSNHLHWLSRLLVREW